MFFKSFNRFLMEEAPVDGGGVDLTQQPVDDPTSPETPPTDQPPTEFEGPEWLKNLSEEFQQDKTLQNFKDINDLAKSYIHSRKLIGKDKVAIPDEHATEDDWKEFYSKMGLPERDKYEVKFGEAQYSEDFKKGYMDKAHQAGLLPKQAEELFGFFNEQVSNASEETLKAQQDAIKEQVDGLKKEWGAGYEKNIKKAQIAFQTFADEDTTKYLQETGLSQDVNLLKLFAKVGEKLNEDTFDRNTVSHLGLTKEEAQEKIETIMGDSSHPYWNGEHPNHKSAVEKMLKYNKIIDS